MNLRHLKLASAALVSISGSLAFVVTHQSAKAQNRQASPDLRNEIADYRAWKQIHKPSGPDLKVTDAGVLAGMSPAEVGV